MASCASCDDPVLVDEFPIFVGFAWSALLRFPEGYFDDDEGIRADLRSWPGGPGFALDVERDGREVQLSATAEQTTAVEGSSQMLDLVLTTPDGDVALNKRFRIPVKHMVTEA